MHEMSLAESVIQIMEQQSREQGFQRVKQAWLKIGLLSSVDVEALRFCLEVVSRDTLAADAEFIFVEEAGRGWCLLCEQEIEISVFGAGCPICGRHQIQLMQGESMRLEQLQVD